MLEKIVGIEKILNIEPDFQWNYFNFINSFKYKIEYNEYMDKISILKIEFNMISSKKMDYQVVVRFNEINCLEMDNIGGTYNQLMGFEVIDKKNDNWENENGFFINDYENGIIKFFCKSIEIISVKNMENE